MVCWTVFDAPCHVCRLYCTQRRGNDQTECDCYYVDDKCLVNYFSSFKYISSEMFSMTYFFTPLTTIFLEI